MGNNLVKLRFERRDFPLIAQHLHLVSSRYNLQFGKLLFEDRKMLILRTPQLGGIHILQRNR